MTDYLIIFDGGSKGNPGPAFGSFRIKPWTSASGKLERLYFGSGTNNEAEYLTLIGALRSLRSFLDGRGTSPESVNLELRGDSQLVLRQVKGEWKAKDERMRELRDEVQRLLEPFGAVRIVEEPREKMVEALGH